MLLLVRMLLDARQNGAAQKCIAWTANVHGKDVHVKLGVCQDGHIPILQSY